MDSWFESSEFDEWTISKMLRFYGLLDRAADDFMKYGQYKTYHEIMNLLIAICVERAEAELNDSV